MLGRGGELDEAAVALAARQGAEIARGHVQSVLQHGAEREAGGDHRLAETQAARPEADESRRMPGEAQQRQVGGLVDRHHLRRAERRAGHVAAFDHHMGVGDDMARGVHGDARAGGDEVRIDGRGLAGTSPGGPFSRCVLLCGSLGEGVGDAGVDPRHHQSQRRSDLLLAPIVVLVDEGEVAVEGVLQVLPAGDRQGEQHPVRGGVLGVGLEHDGVAGEHRPRGALDPKRQILHPGQPEIGDEEQELALRGEVEPRHLPPDDRAVRLYLIDDAAAAGVGAGVPLRLVGQGGTGSGHQRQAQGENRHQHPHHWLPPCCGASPLALWQTAWTKASPTDWGGGVENLASSSVRLPRTGPRRLL